MIRNRDPGFAINVERLRVLGDCAVAEQVIDPPPAIEFAGPPSVAPPRVRPRSLAGLLADEVVPAGFEETPDPLPLVRQEAGGVLVGLGVEDVVLGVGDVEVPAEQGRYAGLRGAIGPRAERVEPAFLLAWR